MELLQADSLETAQAEVSPSLRARGVYTNVERSDEKSIVTMDLMIACIAPTSTAFPLGFS
jgi:hypothetical protein